MSRESDRPASAARRRVDPRLRVLGELARIKPGEDWVMIMLRCAAEALGVRTAYLSTPVKGKEGHAQIVAGWDAGSAREPIDFLLKDTPCGEVLARGELFLDSGLCSRFPTDVWLADRGESAFMGRRLQSSRGDTLGVFGLLNPHEVQASDPDRLALFDVFVAMTELHLERILLLEQGGGQASALDPRLGSVNAVKADGTTIIVFDADPRVRQALSRALIAEGHEPLLVESTDQLLRTSKRFTPGVALVDSQFPGADLKQLIGCLREALPDVRVLLLAGDAKLSVPQVVALGADSLLRKPFTPAQLGTTIEALLHGASVTN